MKRIIILSLLLISFNGLGVNKVSTYESINQKILIIKSNKNVYKLLKYLTDVDSLKRLQYLSEAVIESNWGNSSLSTNHNNYFGIKGKDVELMTTEYNKDSLYHCKQSFKKFNSIKECIEYRINKVKSMGTCPSRIYVKLQDKIKLTISKQFTIKDTVIWYRK